MKIALWIVLCGLCVTAGHVILGAFAILLLLGCVPVRRESEPEAEHRERAPHLV
ncbi:hypothetical protein [Amycolatopsis sp. H20-H5]|uniref:hypothetical protein n=1 Tax=Amycolatopsis sp. H20-H5 TaxID=3046309 RepID=UPI002DBA9266|nr:hypothetical protein [Amycolatopsis sp. H20-H5]MEC3980734.1 hypothetical protein [Amycolatopsis sp. H20-H5]